MAGNAPMTNMPTFTPTTGRRRALELSWRFPGWIVAVGVPVATRWGYVLTGRDWDHLEALLGDTWTRPRTLEISACAQLAIVPLLVRRLS